MKTEFEKSGYNSVNYKLRFATTQSHIGCFPIMVYNIGLQKLVIQQFIGAYNSMIYHIPEEEKF